MFVEGIESVETQAAAYTAQQEPDGLKSKHEQLVKAGVEIAQVRKICRFKKVSHTGPVWQISRASTAHMQSQHSL